MRNTYRLLAVVQYMSLHFKQLINRIFGYDEAINQPVDPIILDLICEQTQNTIWQADLDGNLTYINDHKSPSRFDQKEKTEIIKSILNENKDQLMKLDFGHSLLVNHEVDNCIVETRVRAIQPPSQQNVGFIGITTFNMNVPDQPDPSSQQDASVKILGDFLEAASHDLRTPLSIINTQVYLLENSKDEAKVKHHIQTLKSTNARLQKTLDSMFAMARLDSFPPFVSNPVQLDSLLHNVVINFQDEAKAKNLTLEVCQHDVIPSILGHESEFQKAFLNIVRNAIQNTEADGVIHIKIDMDHANIKIEFVDNGKGISADDLPFVFDRFYRVEKYRPAGDDVRIGLGLSIAKRIIEKHNGQITIDSTLGEGTQVTILLPTD